MVLGLSRTLTVQPKKSKNPSPTSQVHLFRILRRIEKEKKQSRIKDRMLKMGVDNYARMEVDTSYSIEPPSEIFVINDGNDHPPQANSEEKKKPAKSKGLKRNI